MLVYNAYERKLYEPFCKAPIRITVTLCSKVGLNTTRINKIRLKINSIFYALCKKNTFLRKHKTCQIVKFGWCVCILQMKT